MVAPTVPSIDFSWISGLPDQFAAGRTYQRENQLRDEIKSAIDPTTGTLDFQKAATILLKYKPEEGLKIGAALEQAKALDAIRTYSALPPGAKVAASMGQAGLTSQAAAPAPAALPNAVPPVEQMAPSPAAGPAPNDAQVAPPTRAGELAVSNMPMPNEGWSDLGGGFRARVKPGQQPPSAAPAGVPAAAVAPSGMTPGFSEGTPQVSPVGREPPTGYENTPAAVTRDYAPSGTEEILQERAKNIEKLRTTFPVDQALTSDVIGQFDRIEKIAKTFLTPDGKANDSLKALTGTYQIGSFDTGVPKAYSMNISSAARAAGARYKNMGIQVGLAALAKMRAAAANGSSGMGQLAIQESYWLQQSVTALDEAQGPEQAAQAMKDILYWTDQVKQVVGTKYQQTYSGLR